MELLAWSWRPRRLVGRWWGGGERLRGEGGLRLALPPPPRGEPKGLLPLLVELGAAGSLGLDPFGWELLGCCTPLRRLHEPRVVGLYGEGARPTLDVLEVHGALVGRRLLGLFFCVYGRGRGSCELVSAGAVAVLALVCDGGGGHGGLSCARAVRRPRWALGRVFGAACLVASRRRSGALRRLLFRHRCHRRGRFRPCSYPLCNRRCLLLRPPFRRPCLPRWWLRRCHIRRRSFRR